VDPPASSAYPCTGWTRRPCEEVLGHIVKAPPAPPLYGDGRRLPRWSGDAELLHFGQQSFAYPGMCIRASSAW